MNLVSFALIFTGVMLNAAAQILMKAGTNAVGHFEFSMENIVPVGLRLATEWHIFFALCCYALSVVMNAVAAWYFLGEAFNPTKAVGIGVIILGVIIISRA